MQRLELIPDHLAAMAQAAATEVLTLEYDDAQAALLSSSALALLKRNEYILVMALLRQRVRWQDAPGRIPFGLSLEHLVELVQSTSPGSVERQLQNAALKVAGLGLRIYPLHGERQYFVLFTPEVVRPPRGAAADPLPFDILR